MTDTNVIKLAQPGTFADPLTEILRNGARTLLAQAVETEVADFLGRYADLKTEAGHREGGATRCVHGREAPPYGGRAQEPTGGDHIEARRLHARRHTVEELHDLLVGYPALPLHKVLQSGRDPAAPGPPKGVVLRLAELVPGSLAGGEVRGAGRGPGQAGRGFVERNGQHM